MMTPPTIIAVAASRNANIPLPKELIRNLGRIRLRTRLYIATKIGRLPMIAETKDTGPRCIAQNDNTIPTGASVSLKVSRAIDEFLCFMPRNCLRVCGRSETSKKIPDKQNAVILYTFQNEM